MQARKGRQSRRERIKRKIRSKVAGANLRPRLSASDIKSKSGTKRDRAMEVGKTIAKLAKEAKITEIVFDRNGFNYTGRIKLLADSAREGGLIF